MAESPTPTIPIFTSPDHLRLYRHLLVALALVTIALLVSLGVNAYLYSRKPDLLTAVVTENGRRVVTLNNRDFGATEAVQLGPDRLSNEDKLYLAGEYVRALYALDPASRQNDIERALRMMVPSAAVKYGNFLKASGQLEIQRRENWQAVWKELSRKVDPNDPYLIHLVGEQQITKVVNDQTLRETVQHALDVKLSADPPRSDRNLRSGFLVAAFEGQELKRAPSN
jgi:hypothetical protein